MKESDVRGHAEIQATYDAVAQRYAAEYEGDMADKVFDRALLSAFAELVRATERRQVADLGCGPGFEAKFLVELGLEVVGVDLSPAMIAEAQRRHAGVPGLEFTQGSMLGLPFADAGLAGAIAIYSVIHLDPAARARAYAEMARVVAPGGVLLLSVHTSAVGFPSGSTRRLEEWWGHRVGLDGHFIAADEVVSGLAGVGFAIEAKLERGPSTSREFSSQRAYLVARRG